ncbi:putative membrane protein [Toxoplasma gondii TgCatPRC2]|uniref:Transmembrane protein n=13 Tax=Toxoplasma gondii TaxID=5811 RepID=A0A125YKW5_TOXGG|nr:hypothetical protein TGME49_278460 [Toxoplasma gondii ME49]EPR63188.1 hypothetical protein TGGT1_278460 [Toxoplasma gondii GT1]ESS34611.1 putative membrane protein [Toxoplasma gondii VEG]KAF4638929.1 hypothetical protein TGRH88_065380 [Toxoplasma gondii]KFG32071.1 putative membrane protein [Toxoplasma gondii p89]KFG34581.1 putative membrane protein [Toxoplasma gondii GAB2-2007-GAL-DOM2]KFG46092.1 putative membrane protein [Toxoplasma gondii FOU]KFH09296.1 putative membrane protein [Toxopl|eukprot:XP_002370549.1 hypothetical protein TGME49_278460 [Toxoplasma gondii ME49]
MSPSYYVFSSSVFLELLFLIDRLLVNWLGPVLYAFLLFYKYYACELALHLLPADIVFYISFFYVNRTRLAAGSAGNKSGSASLIFWFWTLSPFSLAAHVYSFAGLPLVLTVDILFTALALSVFLLQIIWSVVIFLLSNTDVETESPIGSSYDIAYAAAQHH